MQGIKGQRMDTLALRNALQASTFDRLLDWESCLLAFHKQFWHLKVLENLMGRNRNSVVNPGKMFDRGRPLLFTDSTSTPYRGEFDNAALFRFEQHKIPIPAL
jgi:hypothetical protein